VWWSVISGPAHLQLPVQSRGQTVLPPSFHYRKIKTTATFTSLGLKEVPRKEIVLRPSLHPQQVGHSCRVFLGSPGSLTLLIGIEDILHIEVLVLGQLSGYIFWEQVHHILGAVTAAGALLTVHCCVSLDSLILC